MFKSQISRLRIEIRRSRLQGCPTSISTFLNLTSPPSLHAHLYSMIIAEDGERLAGIGLVWHRSASKTRDCSTGDRTLTRLTVKEHLRCYIDENASIGNESNSMFA